MAQEENFSRVKEALSPEDTARLEYINATAVRYYEQMKAASNGGPSLESVMDAPALAALHKLTASAKDGVATSPRGAFVPTVTETEGGLTRTYDLFSLLMKQRVVLLEGQVDDAMASVACASLLYLKS